MEKENVNSGKRMLKEGRICAGDCERGKGEYWVRM